MLFKRTYFRPHKEHRQLAVVTDGIYFLPTPNRHLPATPPSTDKRKRVDHWSQRAGPQSPTNSAGNITGDRLNHFLSRTSSGNPLEIIAPDDHDEEATHITSLQTKPKSRHRQMHHLRRGVLKDHEKHHMPIYWHSQTTTID
jgi:hypothetical protein